MITGPRWAVYRVGKDSNHYVYLILYPWKGNLAIEQGAGDVESDLPTTIINNIREQGNSVRWRASAGNMEFALYNKAQKELGRKLIEGSMNCDMVAP